MAGQSAMLTRKEAARMQAHVEVDSLSVNHAAHGMGGEPECHSQKGITSNPVGHDHHPPMHGKRKK